MRVILFLTGLISFLAGCAKKSYRPCISSDVQRVHMRSFDDEKSQQEEPVATNSYTLLECEARCVDIFIPFGATLTDYVWDAGNAQLTMQYVYQSSQQDIVMNYILEMERLGWDCEQRFTGSEEILLFKKPNKVCITSCVPSNKNYLLKDQKICHQKIVIRVKYL